MLGSILNGEVITYSTGLAAIHAYLCTLRPKKVAIGGGYHGTHDVLELQEQLTGCQKVDLNDVETLDMGDVIHLETPVNPSGEARNITKYAEVAQRRKLWLVVDSTFGPPALQDPFVWGADLVIHSATKFIGGHSDMLCGVLATPPRHSQLALELFQNRRVLGSIPGGLESWLGLRSVRTLDIRTRQQSQTATALVTWLEEMRTSNRENPISRLVLNITHPSLQKYDLDWIKKQMPGGFGSIFGMRIRTEMCARRLPSKLRIFQHATSLGGVESLIEWRKMTDNLAKGDVLRVSVGIEALEDLKKDILNGFQALIDEMDVDL